VFRVLDLEALECIWVNHFVFVFSITANYSPIK
jgi:hypothetical protein